jgi:large subunit ribosomal protein L4
MKFKTINLKNGESGDYSVEAKKNETNLHLLYLVNKAQWAANRAGCACAKTRADVAGGGAKPYRQKGTGRARRGTNRTPLRRGGGVIFAPKPRDFSQKMSKRDMNKAMVQAILSRANDIYVIQNADSEIIMKTRDMVKILTDNKINKNDKKTLLMSKNEENVALGFRNIDRFQILDVNFTPVSVILDADVLLLTEGALKCFEEKVKKWQ